MFGNFRHIIALLFLVAIGAGFYYFATSDNFFTQHKNRAAQIDQETEKLKVEVIAPLNRLSAVSIDTGFFSSQEYKMLQDMSVTLNPPVLVRANPFSPIE